jgi:large subunit ribosomal protein L27e
MVRFIKPGRVVIVLSGRNAGKKAVIVRCYDEGTKDRTFPHALVAGVKKSPLFITQKMHEKKQERRTRVRAFVKYVNYQHLLPTRYLLAGDLDLKGVVTDEKMASVKSRKELRKELRNVLTKKYTSQAAAKKGEKPGSLHTKFLFSKLRF